MTKSTPEPIVVSVGGSLLVPKEIDLVFLRSFCRLMKAERKRFRWIVVVGGGQTCRTYQSAARRLGRPTSVELDELGIDATIMNARLLKIALGKSAAPFLARNLVDIDRQANHRILLCAGWAPGQSSDGVAVDVALHVGAKRIINLTNIAGVMAKDPRRFPRQIPLAQVSWPDYFRIVGTKSRSGEHVPFGIVGAKKAQFAEISVAVLLGKPLKTFAAYLAHRPWKGTLIGASVSR